MDGAELGCENQASSGQENQPRYCQNLHLCPYVLNVGDTVPQRRRTGLFLGGWKKSYLLMHSTQ